MKILSKLLISLLIFFSLGQSFGQKLLWPTSNVFEGRFFEYRLPDLGNYAVTYFYFDNKGFLWLGTNNRLYRLDGPEFRRIGYTSNDSTGFDGKLVTGICEDITGNFWISTTSALNRYNIKSGLFNHFFPDTADLMSDNNSILHLLKIKNETLWMITSGDIFSFNINSGIFKKYPIDTISQRQRQRPYLRDSGKLFEDTSGRIWFATPNGLYMHNGREDKLIVFRHSPENLSSISSNNISCITEDNLHNIWIATLDRGLNRAVDPEKGIFERINLGVKAEYSSKFDTIRTLLPDMDGSLWVFGNEMFGCYSPLKGDFKGYLIPHGKSFGLKLDHIDFESAFQIKADEIWFLQVQGIMFRFTKKTEKVILYLVPNYLIFHAIQDKTGSFWFSCPEDHFWRFVFNSLPYQSFLTFRVINTPSISLIHSPRIAEESNKKIWFTFSSQIYNAENIGIGSGIKLKKFYFPDGDSTARCIMKDHEGNLWMSRPNGIIVKKARLDNKFTVYRKPGDPKNQIYDIKEDHHGNLWFTEGTNLFWKQSGSERIETFNFSSSEASSRYKLGLFDFLVDKNDNFWFAQFDNGVYVYDLKSKMLNHYSASSGINIQTGDNCWRIKEDAGGRIWLLYSMNGLYLFDPENRMLSNINLGSKITPGTLYLDFLIDKDGKIRITHTGGMTIYDPDSHNVKHVPFDVAIYNCFSYQLSSGEILFSNGNDLLLFQDPIPSNIEIPEIYITSLLVNNTEYNKLFPQADEIRTIKKISLNHKQNNLRIEFTALNYLDSRNNMYRYFMEGMDNDTITTTSANKYTEYKKMQPGKYRFWVTGSNNDGVWNQTGKTIDIMIHPPWFRSMLAEILYITLLVFLIVLFVRRRLSIHKVEISKLEAKVAERTKELEEKTLQIEEMDKLKTRFFTSISHEIRTPLSLIVGPIDNLTREDNEIDDDRRMKWMEMIRRNGMRLLNLVNQLLDISRFDAGKMKLTIAESDIMKCLKMLVYEFLSMAESRKIRFIINLPDESYITFYDKDKIEKIVSNLLSNAFKFTPSFGTVSCRIEIKEPDGTGQSPNLLIEVKDTGAGMNKEHLDKIFDRFYRVEGQWESGGTGAGTGIGLSLVEEFVTLLHGSIEVTSEPGLGSTFKVRIPLGKERLNENEFVMVDVHPDELYLQRQQIDYHLEIAENEIETSEKKIHLLIVEDNADIRTYIRESLPSEYLILEADNGKTGIDIAFSKIPDLVITDLIMPDVDGLELCKRLKNDERTSHIPLIMLTAKTTMEEKIEGLTSGADDYICKPFDINELKIRISNLLVQREKLRLKFGLLTGFEQPDMPHQSIDEKFMNRISKIINENISDFDFNVDSLQEKVGMSRVHLYRKLKAITGLSPSLIIRNYRMKKAAKLISEKAGNLTEIALSVGFSNPAYFSKCFRDYYGVSHRDFTSSQKEQTETEK